jgi:hypothetical protein
MRQKFICGSIVAVINRIGGRYILEGRATILERIDGIDNYYRVEFIDKNKGIICQRFVSPEAQADPGAFVESMNSYSGKPLA